MLPSSDGGRQAVGPSWTAGRCHHIRAEDKMPQRPWLSGSLGNGRLTDRSLVLPLAPFWGNALHLCQPRSFARPP